MTVVLSGSDLTLAELVRVARAAEPVELAPAAVARMRAARAVIEAAATAGQEVYGLTTGVGAKKKAAVAPEDQAEFNRLLVLNHRVGQGPALPDDVVRAALCRLVNGLGSGSPVRPELAQALVDALNAGVRPLVRRYGSIGIADLSANADLAHGALGDFPLEAGEALALLCHNAVSTGHAALALADAAALLEALDVAGALDLEAFGANVGAFDPAVAKARPYAGLGTSLEHVRGLLDGSYLWHDGVVRNLQDPLCFRCLPQVHGAARDALGFASEQLAVELNAAQGNPLVVDEQILAVGNFDALPLAAALDLARIALAPVLTIACERSLKLLQRPLSGLPEGLAVREGIAEDGLSEFGIAMQAIVAEARLLAQPVSFEVVSSTQAEGIEDRATMAPLAARRLAEQVELGTRAVAIELVVASQALDLRSARPLGRGTSAAYEAVRALVPPLRPGEPIPQDLEPVVALVLELGA
jgi:histidine ammonia-lyase